MATKRPNVRKFDMDRDGQISSDDLDQANAMLELDLRESKANTQRKMAWSALLSMALFTLYLFSPFISDSRVAALADLLGLFYIAQAGIVGAYMGVTAWMANNNNSSSRYYDSSYSVARYRTSTKSVVEPYPEDDK